MYTALIVDDETDARSVLRKSLQLFCPQFTAVREARDRAEAIDQLKDGLVDITFLDIRLKKENGIDIYPELAEYCRNIVFVTAYDEYAVKAFKTEALHYLLKPIDPEDLEKAVKRAQIVRDHIVISNLNSRTQLACEEILFLNSDGPYVHFHTADGRVVTGTHGLMYYSKRLCSNQFQRSHQSFLVNLRQVVSTNSDKVNGEFVLLRGYHKPIPLAKRRRKKFLYALQNLD